MEAGTQIAALYINGAWLTTGRTFEVFDPGTGEKIGEMASGGADEARLAIEAAQASFPGWRALTAMRRGDYLLAVADLLAGRREEIGRIIVRENGKPLAQAIGEVAVSIDHLRWFAEEARRAYGRIVPHQADGKRHLVVRRPIGVSVAIAPWNFPLVLAVRKVAPALAAGCPVILRPATKTPLCAVALATCMQEAGLPKGVFQLLCGPAEPIVAACMEHPSCRKISFTGSTKVGRSLLVGSARTMTNLSLELGGQAPFILFADADLEAAVQGALIAKFRNNGQSCIAANRFYVERPIYKRFVERFAEEASRLKVGYGLEEGVDIGSLIDAAGLQTALDHIEDATRRGASVVCGGRRIDRAGGGYYLAPTLLVDVPADALCMREETFAPVAPICQFDHEEEAIAAANDTIYGLAAYAYTGDLNRAWRLAERLESGSIAINDAIPSTSNCPFGGYKQSGIGRELGSEGLDAFMETSHISFGGID